MAEFVLKSNFEFNGQVKHQISGTEFAPTCAFIFLDEIETKFQRTRKLQPLVRFMYIRDVFFIWTRGTDKLVSFMTEFKAILTYSVV